MAVTSKSFAEIPTAHAHGSGAVRFSQGGLFCFSAELALENFPMALMLWVRINLLPSWFFLGAFYVLSIECG